MLVNHVLQRKFLSTEALQQTNRVLNLGQRKSRTEWAKLFCLRLRWAAKFLRTAGSRWRAMRLGDNFRKMRDAGPHCFRPFVRNMFIAHNDNSERYCAFHFNGRLRWHLGTAYKRSIGAVRTKTIAPKFFHCFKLEKTRSSMSAHPTTSVSNLYICTFLSVCLCEPIDEIVFYFHALAPAVLNIF